MLIFYLFWTSFSIDLYLKLGSPDSRDCTEKEGCSLNSFMQYLEDTNGDTLYLLDDFLDGKDSDRLLIWLSTKSYSELTVIGAPTKLILNSTQNTQKIRLNETVLSLRDISFINMPSSFFYAYQTILTFDNVNFSNNKINGESSIQIESGSLFLSNVRIESTFVHHNSFIHCNDTKIQASGVTLKNFELTTSKCFIFEFDQNCDIDFSNTTFKKSVSLNTVYYMDGCSCVFNLINAKNSNITLFNFVHSSVTVYGLNIHNSDFSLGRITETSLYCMNSVFSKLQASRNFFDIERSNFHFHSFVITDCIFSSIIRCKNRKDNFVSFKNGNFTNLVGLTSSFTFVDSKVLFDQIYFRSIKVQLFSNFFMAKNSFTNLTLCKFDCFSNALLCDYIFSIRNGRFHLDNSQMFNCSMQIFDFLSVRWVIDKVNITDCQCHVPNNQYEMALFKGSGEEPGLMSDCQFFNCLAFQGIIYCHQCDYIVFRKCNFTHCQAVKAGPFSLLFCNVTLVECYIQKCFTPYPSGLITLWGTRSVFEFCSFEHNIKALSPTIRLISPESFVLRNVKAKHYKIFSVFHNTDCKLTIMNCEFGGSLSDTFLVENTNLLQMIAVEFLCNQQCAYYGRSMSDQFSLSTFNYRVFAKEEEKLSKCENYNQFHENYIYSQTRYYEYMNNHEPLSRDSPPFRKFKIVDSYDDPYFVEDITKTADFMEISNTKLILLSISVITLITIKYVLLSILKKTFLKKYINF
ncbi:hypothetical protein TRFO_38466 [Tritrichomonas foetus]|uniref:Right handed beta helix domain-containing protein n=1 Tax=Tritrichomonas foetus TaxID=1144522 RepID=A0A1J4J9W4_9EUKA|nr:hypothetical protein TRFO_38466 [Tritrichomonas foetus]|eukprot:OHS95457.1 hypothetical protein TRFO_38466 [Tritrichomonas foetus]